MRLHTPIAPARAALRLVERGRGQRPALVITGPFYDRPAAAAQTGQAAARTTGRRSRVEDRAARRQ